MCGMWQMLRSHHLGLIKRKGENLHVGGYWKCGDSSHQVKPNYQGNCIKRSSNTKFLGLTIDDSLSWKAHIDQMMSKLNTACFVIRMIQAIMSLETLRRVYFAYIHSIISYGIIFGREINHIVIRFSKSKKGWLESLQVQEREIHVGNC